jgi:cytochrome c-type biogenesis protein CcmH
VIILLLSSLPWLSLATTPIYSFQQPQQQQLFQRVLTEFRCLVCQNEDLADSDATLAQDLRQQIYQQVKQGKNEQDIKQYLVSRYGDFVLYNPPFQANTYLLWIMPFVIIMIGVLIWLGQSKGKRHD